MFNMYHRWLSVDINYTGNQNDWNDWNDWLWGFPNALVLLFHAYKNNVWQIIKYLLLGNPHPYRKKDNTLRMVWTLKGLFVSKTHSIAIATVLPPMKSHLIKIYRIVWQSRRTTDIYLVPIYFYPLAKAILWLWRYRFGY